jgi:hypothetical protein
MYNKLRIAMATILLLATHTQTQAQITIGQADMPSVGDTIRISIPLQSLGSLINQSGANVSWVATGLTPIFQDIVHYRTPISINFLFASFNSSTYGTESSAPAFGNFGQGSDGYEFYRNSSANFIRTGRAFSFPGVPIPLTQNYADTMLRFPLTFGDKDSCTWTSNEVNAIVATIRSTGKRVNEVDGWGSITTPYGTFDCIRVKSVVRTTDTIRTSFLPIPFPITTTTTEYKWFANGQKIPILEVSVPTGGIQNATIKYRDNNRPEVFVNSARFNINKTVFPVNSARDTCTLTDVSVRNPISRLWTITPNTFTFVGGTNNTSQRAQIIFQQTGTYTVSLRVNYRAGSDDTVATDLISVQQGPKAGFTADRFGGNPTDIIQFTDTSTGEPFSHEWSFNPSTVSFVGGTSAFSQNPRLLFDASGVYSVSLLVENEVGTDLITRQGYISIFPTGLNRLVSKQYLVYPNPVDKELRFQSTEHIDEVQIYSLAGKLVAYKKVDGIAVNIDVEDLPKGLYILKVIHTSGNEGVLKIQVAR